MQKNQQTINQTIKGTRSGALIRRQRRILAILLVLSFVTAGLFTVRPRKVEAVSLGLVISQVYGGAGCGTAGCSTYQNDYIELYNRGKTVVTCTGCSVQYAAATGTAWQVTVLPATLVLQPGQYYLVAESFGANGVNPLPTPDTSGTIAMSATAAKVALVNGTTALSGACPTLNGTGSPAILDFIGYGTTPNCFEGAPAPAPSTTTADIRNGGGNVDTDINSTDFQALAPTPRNTASALGTPTASDSSVSGRIATDGGAAIAGAVVNLRGTQNRRTITDANGNYHFDNVETDGFYTVAPSDANFSFNPSEHSFSQLGNSTEASFTASRTSGFVNPLDTPEYFVRQHYLDFLGREPDESGFNFWSDQIIGCGNDAGCGDRRRVNVSAAYFLSVEFQETGGLVDRLYKASFGRNPRYAEFMPDTAAIARGVVVGRSGWQQLLAANKESFVAGWTDRATFRAAYDRLANADYIDALVSNTGANFAPGERDSLLSSLNTGMLSRGQALQQIANNENFAKARFNEAFVEMEYFGYLRRDPDASGYQYWLDKLNQFNGNFERAEMVRAFIDSGEYRSRFAQ
jgi:hypothetical protein